MDQRWALAAERILEIEGGKTTDHAGPTNMGITLRFLRANASVDRDGDGFLDGDYDRDGDVDQDDLDRMDSIQALDLYKRHFWDAYGYGELHSYDHLCVKVFDLAVNAGPRQSHKLLQRAACANGARLNDDGIIGPRTRAAITSIPGFKLLVALRSEAAGFYRLIASKNPNYRVFLRGWLRRAYEL